MVSVTRHNIVNVAVEHPRADLVSSLRPILWSLRVFGISLNVGQSHSVYRRCTFLSLGLSVIFLFCYFTYEQTLILRNRFIYHPEIKFAFAMIFNCSRAIVTLLVAATLLVNDQLKWKKLWTKLQEVEQTHCFTVQFYNQTRIAIIIVLIITVLQVYFFLKNNFN